MAAEIITILPRKFIDRAKRSMRPRVDINAVETADSARHGLDCALELTQP